MNARPRHSAILTLLIAPTIAFSLPPPRVRPPATSPADVDPATLCGRLERLGDLPVLYLWGTPEQRGIAQGYLLASEIHAMLTEYLDDRALSGGPTVYENVTLRMITSPALQRGRRIDDELRGMLNGILARLGDKGAEVASLKRAINLADLMAFQSASDAPPLGCSSFAAWGKLTTSGKTIAARNLDWFASKCLLNHRVLVVRAPDPSAHRLGWVSLTWAGAIGCYTGMNSEGVTVCIHDVPRGLLQTAIGMVPRPLLLREAIETARASSATQDILGVLTRHRVMMGTNVPVAIPAGSASTPSVVFEYDGRGGRGADAANDNVTARKPDAGHDWQICTNHFRCRTPVRATVASADGADGPAAVKNDASPKPATTDNTAGQCVRYDRLRTKLTAAAERGVRIDVQAAGKLLAAVGFDGSGPHRLMTLQSVIFEPDARLMHVAVARGRSPSTRQAATKVDVTELLSAASRR